MGGFRADIFKLLVSPGIDSKKSIAPAYLAWEAGTKTLFPTQFLAPIDCSKFQHWFLTREVASYFSGQVSHYLHLKKTIFASESQG